jgi:hypothetical protein
LHLRKRLRKRPHDLLDVVEKLGRAPAFAPPVLGFGHGQQRVDRLTVARVSGPVRR